MLEDVEVTKSLMKRMKSTGKMTVLLNAVEVVASCY